MNDVIAPPELPAVYLSFDGPPECQAKLIAELALARLEFGKIEKDRVGQYGNQRFQYSPLGTLTEATAKPLADHGIVTMQFITNSPTDPAKHRLTTMVAGHGASIRTALDFSPQQAKEDGAYKGEWIKEYGKLCTYLCRYQYRTTFVLDSEPDADDAPAEQPQKRREAPTPPPPRQEPKPAAPKQETPRATQTPPPPVQHEGHFKQGQLQTVPSAPINVPQPTPKSDPLLEKLTTVSTEGATGVTPSEPTVDRDVDEPADEDLQNQLLALYRTAGMTKIQFNQLCLEAVGVPSTEVRNSAKLTRKVLEAMKAKIKGAA